MEFCCTPGHVLQRRNTRSWNILAETFWKIVFWCLRWHFTGLQCMAFPVTSCTCKQLCIAGQMVAEGMTLPWVTAATKFLVGCGGHSCVQPAKWTAREQRKSALLRAPWGLKKWLFSLESTLTLAIPRAYPKDASWSFVASRDMFCNWRTTEAGTFLPSLLRDCVLVFALTFHWFGMHGLSSNKLHLQATLHCWPNARRSYDSTLGYGCHKVLSRVRWQFVSTTCKVNSKRTAQIGTA